MILYFYHGPDKKGRFLLFVYELDIVKWTHLQKSHHGKASIYLLIKSSTGQILTPLAEMNLIGVLTLLLILILWFYWSEKCIKYQAVHSRRVYVGRQVVNGTLISKRQHDLSQTNRCPNKFLSLATITSYNTMMLIITLIIALYKFRENTN